MLGIIVDYAEFGTVVAAIAATGAVEHTASKAVDSVSDGVVLLRSKLRSWLAQDDNNDQLIQTLETAEQAPSEFSIEMLATALKIAAANDPDGAKKIDELARRLSSEAFAKSTVINATVKGKAKVDKLFQAGGDITVHD